MHSTEPMNTAQAFPLPGEAVIRDASRGRWLLFRDPQRIVSACSLEDVPGCMQLLEDAVMVEGFHAAGFISYEAAPAFDRALRVRDPDGFPLLWFGIYRAAEPVRLPRPGDQPPVRHPQWEPSITKEEYFEALERIRDHLRRGCSYQVNFTYRLRSAFPLDPWDYFLRYLASHDSPYGAYLHTGRWSVCSASPELFFSLDGGRIVSKPMKGTAPRGLTPEEDRRLSQQLLASEKERAENLMIVDMVRNDMGRIAVPGSVQVNGLFDLEQYPSVWQMTSTVEARTDASLADVFSALFPPASITGAPKARTMDIISRLEGSARKVYTGAFGFMAPGRRAQFNVAIRTLLVDHESMAAEYGVGGGIVWDSQQEAEWQESLIKARILSDPTPAFSLLSTMLWTPSGGWFLLDYHLTRMERSARHLGFPWDRHAVLQVLERRAAGFSGRPMRVRLLLAKDGMITVEHREHDAPVPSAPMRVALAAAPVDSTSPLLFHKTTHRRTYEEALKVQPGHADVLLYNERFEVTESTIANCIVEIDHALFTPPVSCGLLPGTFRSWLLDQGAVAERVITVDEALASPRVYLMNSVRGIYEVSIVKSGAQVRGSAGHP